MATTQTVAAASADVVDELRAWLEPNWDPDLTVGEWWERLGLAGWAAPGLPAHAFGRGLSRGDAVRVMQEIERFGALGPPAGLGVLLAAPTIAAHGTQDQIDRLVRDAVTGKAAWCQLFSEPGAGSDLAGLTTRAVEDGDEFVVNGQKVWTSGGNHADLGMLLARTNPDVPKHQGITWFAFDMHQPGVEVRPLRELTGRAMFSEVFMTDARVGRDAIIGDKNNGWAVANTTLMFERAGLGAGGGGAGGGATPGTVVGHLGTRAGDFVGGRGSRGSAEGALAGAMNQGSHFLSKLAAENGAIADPTIRQDLARLYSMSEIGRISNLRVKAERAAGRDIPGMANISKLAMSDMMRLTRDLGLRILGPFGMLHAYDGKSREVLNDVTGKPELGVVTESALFAQAPSIYGGTDQVQRNILGERVLGLPKEPNNDKTMPFSELPKNG
jgi:alkylation response protein AidB-like acyl-CoA dehydrogenase